MAAFHFPFAMGRIRHTPALPHLVRRPQGTDSWIFEITYGGGAEVHLEDGSVRRCTEDTLLLFPAGVRQDYRMDTQILRWDHGWLSFSPRPHWRDLLTWPMLPGGVRHLRVEDATLRRRIRTRMLQMLKDFQSPLARREDFVLNGLETILLWLDEVNPAAAQARLDDRIRKALDLIVERHAQPLSVPGMAGAVSLSPSRFSHLFREQVGLTPLQYLEKQRIDRARTLLAMTGEPVAVISEQVGIPNAGYFARIFRRHTGRAPLEYRQSGGRAILPAENP